VLRAGVLKPMRKQLSYESVAKNPLAGGENFDPAGLF
jgi:hypothetical protein